MKESKKEAYINTILKYQPKYSKKYLETLEDKQLSTLYKKSNLLPSIIKTQPKEVKSFRRKLFKNKDILFQDIGHISFIREQDNNSFELNVTIKCTKFVSEVNKIMNYNSNSYVRGELSKLFSKDFYYEVNTELDSYKTGFWYWNKYDKEESECFMYLVIVLKNLKFRTEEKKILTGETNPILPNSNYYDKFYYVLWLELEDGRSGYLSRHIIGSKRSNIRFARRFEDLNRFSRSFKIPSYKDFFNYYCTDFTHIKKAEIVECKYKHVRNRLLVV